MKRQFLEHLESYLCRTQGFAKCFGTTDVETFGTQKELFTAVELQYVCKVQSANVK